MGNDVTKRFNLLFRSSGLTKKEFARLLCISPSLLHAYLKGDYHIHKISINLIENGFSLDWLYTGKGSPKLIEKSNENDLKINYSKHYQDMQNWIVKKYGSIIHF